MKFCSNCGARMEDEARFCPECGTAAPVSAPAAEAPAAEEPSQVSGSYTMPAAAPAQAEGKMGQSVLGIVAFILSLTGFFSLIAFVLALIDIIKKRADKRHGLAKAALVISILSMVLSAIISCAVVKAAKSVTEEQVASIIEDTFAEAGLTVPDNFTVSSGDEIIPDPVPGTSATTVTPAEGTSSVSFPETVIVENEYCRYTITSINPEDPYWDYTVNVSCENRTADKTLMFALVDAYVNGWMIDPYWALMVEPGKTEESLFNFSRDELTACGITNPTDITCSFRIYDYNDLMADYIVNESFTIHPLGEDVHEESIRHAGANDITVFDNDIFTAAGISTYTDTFWGFCMDWELENKSDKTIVMFMEDASVNGSACDPYWSVTLAPGTKCISTLSWSEESLKAAGIADMNEISEISFSFEAYDDDSWDELFKDSITISY